jgi:hypothetical protein
MTAWYTAGTIANAGIWWSRVAAKWSARSAAVVLVASITIASWPG